MIVGSEKTVVVRDLKVRIARLTREQRMHILANSLGDNAGVGTDFAFRVGVIAIEGAGLPAEERPEVHGLRGGWTQAQLDKWAELLGDSDYGIIATHVFGENHMTGTREKNSAAPSAS